jgi:hypothetical protein
MGVDRAVMEVIAAMQITIEIPDAIAQRLLPHWSNLAQKLLELLLQAAGQAGLISPEETTSTEADRVSELGPDPQVLQYMEAQAKLYDQQRGDLFLRYQGQYIWFEDGEVRDADDSFAGLMERIYAETGPRPLFVCKVLAQEPQYQVRTPFRMRPL